MRTAESYSQGLPSVGRAAQQELLLPRKLIIFNPGRRKEGGEGEGLREKRRGWQKRGEDGEREWRGGGGGKGVGREREGEQERGVREGRRGEGADCGIREESAGRDWASWSGGSQLGVRGLWEGNGCGIGHCHPCSPSLRPSGSSPRPLAGGGGAPARPTPRPPIRVLPSLS